MTASVARFSIHVERTDGYEFRVRFDKPHYAELLLDEPGPLGNDSAPNAARVLAAAVANCLSASLVFCLDRAGIHPTELRADAEVELVRNDRRRLRIGKIDVTLRPTVDEASSALASCIGNFEDFCVVTQSVREGLDVNVRVEPVSRTSSVTPSS
jgi:organic hydroperoxide reductase OsmC/OhrA